MQLCKDSKEGEVNLDCLELPENIPWLFSHEVAVEVFHQFMGRDLDVQEIEHNKCTSAEGTLLSLTKHDPFAITFVSCLGDDA